MQGRVCLCVCVCAVQLEVCWDYVCVYAAQLEVCMEYVCVCVCAVQLEVCREQVAWAVQEKRTFLRHRIEARLVALHLTAKDYPSALALISKLLTEVSCARGCCFKSCSKSCFSQRLVPGRNCIGNEHELLSYPALRSSMECKLTENLDRCME